MILGWAGMGDLGEDLMRKPGWEDIKTLSPQELEDLPPELLEALARVARGIQEKAR